MFKKYMRVTLVDPTVEPLALKRSKKFRAERNERICVIHELAQ